MYKYRYNIYHHHALNVIIFDPSIDYISTTTIFENVNEVILKKLRFAAQPDARQPDRDGS
jgi:hypothetical protein